MTFTKDDFKRVFWTFVQAVLAYAALAAGGWVPGDAWSWRTFLIGALAAGFSAVKNLVLADGTWAK